VNTGPDDFSFMDIDSYNYVDNCFIYTNETNTSTDSVPKMSETPVRKNPVRYPAWTPQWLVQ
jgi:hypothetical protein